jgi:hypothetical protein
MKSLPCLGVVIALGITNWAAAQSTKPVRQLVYKYANIDEDWKNILGNLWLQVDETGDPSHLKTITSTHNVCVSGTQAEKSACVLRCFKEFQGDPVARTNCVNGCQVIQDCQQQCGAHPTANFVTFGAFAKDFLTKNCSSPTDTCPPCVVNGTATLFGDYDATALVPNPLIGPEFIADLGYETCYLSRFTVNLTVTGSPDVNDLVTTELLPGKGIHINIKASADSPTIKCGGAVAFDATLHQPNFDFYLDPSVTNHKAAWAASSQFHTDVSDAVDHVVDLNSVVEGVVNGYVASFLNNSNTAADIS